MEDLSKEYYSHKYHGKVIAPYFEFDFNDGRLVQATQEFLLRSGLQDWDVGCGLRVLTTGHRLLAFRLVFSILQYIPRQREMAAEKKPLELMEL